MKSKDQLLLEQAYQKVLEQHQQMTPKQEARYQELSDAGYEFDRWEGKDIIVTRRERGQEHSLDLGSILILPDGRCTEPDPQEKDEPERSSWDEWDDMTGPPEEQE